jgi:glutathione S-transferase
VHKLVPVLLHGDRAVCESLVIVQYIDEAFHGPPLLPADPYGRAQARFWASFIDGKVTEPSLSLYEIWLKFALVYPSNLNTLQFSRPFLLSFWMEDGPRKQEFVKEAKGNLALLEGQLQGKSFFGGDAVGLVDIAASGLALWVGVFEEVAGVRVLSSEEHPALCRWAERYVNHASVKECLPSRDELVSMFSASQEAYKLLAKAKLPN